MRGARIVLRDFEDADLEPYASWLRPGHRWRELDGPYYPEPSEDEIARRIDRLRRYIREGAWPEPRERLVIADADGALIGTVARTWISEETLWLSVGIDVYDPRHWGRGIGYEAFGLWCDYLFSADPRLVRLDARTWSGNTRMMRLAERLGFLLEARFRDARVVKGRWFDALGYGVLRREWEARFPHGFAATLPA